MEAQKNMKFRSGIVILTLAFLMIGCSPQRRLNRIIHKNPGLLTQTDTILYRDTVHVSIPSVRADTTISILQAQDTFYFQKEFVHVKTYIKGDSIYIEAKTDPIEKVIYREKRIPITKFVVQKEKARPPYLLILGASALTLLLLYANFRKKK